MAKATNAEGTENGTGGEEGAQGAANTRQRSYIVMPLPAEVKERFESEAKNADASVGPYVRDLLFGFLGLPIPVTTITRRSKYASAEEREAAQKARNQSRSATMRDLMKRFREAQKAGMTPEQAAEAAATGAVQGAPTPA